MTGQQKCLGIMLAAVLMLAISQDSLAQSATITLDIVDNPGQGFNDNTAVAPIGNNPGTTLGEQRLIATQAAADQWAALISSEVEIVVEAGWPDDLACDGNSAVLGSAGPGTFTRDFPNAPEPETWYPIALARSLAGPGSAIVTDPPTGNVPDIRMEFNPKLDDDPNCNLDWYYGMDDGAGPFQADYYGTVLHELAHGLGFASLVNLNSEAGTVGALAGGFPDTFTLNIRDTQTGMDWVDKTNSERETSATNDPNVVWTGATVNASAGSFVSTSAAYSDGSLRLHAPSPIRLGSSISHWTPDVAPDFLLMEPSQTAIDFGQVDLTPALFADIGWVLAGEITLPPTISISPPSISTMLAPEDDDQLTIQIVNSGDDDLNWSITTAAGASSTLSASANSQSHQTDNASSAVPVLSAHALNAEPSQRGFSCSDAPGLLINDNGTFQQGYGYHPTSVETAAFAEPFTVPTAGTLGAVCVGLEADSGFSVPFSLTILLYDASGPGGTPGSFLGGGTATFSGGVSASPGWYVPGLATLDIDVPAGEVYVAAQFDSEPEIIRILADHDGPGDGQSRYRTDGSSWGLISDFAPNHKALLIRPQVIADEAESGCDNPENIGWLSVNPDEGSTAGGTQTPVSVNLDATGLAEGNYEARLCIQSNDNTTPLVEVPITMTVSEEANNFIFLDRF
jgi:hypothetical protein